MRTLPIRVEPGPCHVAPAAWICWLMRSLARLALLLAALTTSGCMVGYAYSRPGPRAPESDPAPPPDWSDLRFTVAATPGLGFAAIHTLRARYGVVAAWRELEPVAGAFQIAVRPGESRDATRESNFLLLMPSFLTFAAVPGYLETSRAIGFTLTAPDGAVLRDTAIASEHVISWLPLALFAPNLFGSISGGEEPELDKVASAEELLAGFLAQAEPFVAAHRPAPEARP